MTVNLRINSTDRSALSSRLTELCGKDGWCWSGHNRALDNGYISGIWIPGILCEYDVEFLGPNAKQNRLLCKLEYVEPTESEAHPWWKPNRVLNIYQSGLGKSNVTLSLLKSRNTFAFTDLEGTSDSLDMWFDPTRFEDIEDQTGGTLEASSANATDASSSGQDEESK